MVRWQAVTVDDFLLTFYVCLSEYITGPWYRQYYGTMFENITRYNDKYLSVRLAIKSLGRSIMRRLPLTRDIFIVSLVLILKSVIIGESSYNGCHQILDEDVVKGRSITLTRVKDWWAKDSKYNRYRYNVDKIKYRLVRSDEKVFEFFKKGEIDMFHLGVPKRWYEQMEIPAVFKGYIQKKSFYNVYPRVPRGLYINHSKRFLNDVNIRIGLQHASNWQKVIDIDLRGDAARLNVITMVMGSSVITKLLPASFHPKHVLLNLVYKTRKRRCASE